MVFWDGSVQIDPVQVVLQVVVEIASYRELFVRVKVSQGQVIRQSKRVVKMQNDLIGVFVNEPKGDLNVSFEVVSFVLFGAVLLQSFRQLGKGVVVRLEVGPDDKVVVY